MTVEVGEETTELVARDATGFPGDVSHAFRSAGAGPVRHTVAGGEDVLEHPGPGEVVWCDDAGVTCRRWNWRQARRTRLHDGTTSARFVLDALGPMSDPPLDAAAEHLLGLFGPGVRVARLLDAPS